MGLKFNLGKGAVLVMIHSVTGGECHFQGRSHQALNVQQAPAGVDAAAASAAAMERVKRASRPKASPKERPTCMEHRAAGQV